MVVLFYRSVAAAPPIGFQLSYEIDAARKDFKPAFCKIAFHPRNTAEKLLVHVGVDEYVSLIKQLADALFACQRMLIRRTVYKRSEPAFAVGVPIKFFCQLFDMLRVKVYVLACHIPLAHHVDVAVIVGRKKQTCQRIVKPRVYGYVVLPFKGYVKRRYYVSCLIKLLIHHSLRLAKFSVAA